ncbi:hypothetical protein HPP92_005001 [Vanilla planifolia]|uniref:DEAD/DEAH-box helicase domain-containing protein n=1 Tax=Vanilla planifolia TaxID=51239 RepID=A0A835RXS0_VANPL|nr:hypothetical protein HPP92_005001 [Vanilla planifolia]
MRKRVSLICFHSACEINEEQQERLMYEKWVREKASACLLMRIGRGNLLKSSSSSPSSHSSVFAMDAEVSSSAPEAVKRDPRTIARKYQIDLCKKAVEENVIVYLGTGCGKTHIAILLMYELGHLIRKPSSNICVFLAPTVPLVRQVKL